MLRRLKPHSPLIHRHVSKVRLGRFRDVETTGGDSARRDLRIRHGAFHPQSDIGISKLALSATNRGNWAGRSSVMSADFSMRSSHAGAPGARDTLDRHARIRRARPMIGTRPAKTRPAWWAPDRVAAIPTAALDPPLVRRLPRSPRLSGPGPPYHHSAAAFAAPMLSISAIV